MFTILFLCSVHFYGFRFSTKKFYYYYFYIISWNSNCLGDLDFFYLIIILYAWNQLELLLNDIFYNLLINIIRDFNLNFMEMDFFICYHFDIFTLLDAMSIILIFFVISNFINISFLFHIFRHKYLINSFQIPSNKIYF